MNAGFQLFYPGLLYQGAPGWVRGPRTSPACISEIRRKRSPSFIKWVEIKISHTVLSRDKAAAAAIAQKRAGAGSTPEVGSS